MMFKSIVLGLVLSQTLQVTVKPNTPITFTFDHDGDDGLGSKAAFRLWCNSAIVKNYSVTESEAGKSVTKNVDGTYTYTLTYAGFAVPGAKTCNISAINSFDLESGKSETVPFNVGGAPNTPIKFKIVVNIGG